MGYSAYLGHPSQLCSVEEVRLQGGKGDGMRLIQIRNAAGMELTISADRCADISRLIFKGDKTNVIYSVLNSHQAEPKKISARKA